MLQSSAQVSRNDLLGLILLAFSTSIPAHESFVRAARFGESIVADDGGLAYSYAMRICT